MKKLVILSTLLASFYFNVNAQTSFDTTYHENLNVDSRNFDYNYNFILTNDSIHPRDTNFTWELTYVDMPEEWEYIVGYDLYCGFLPPVTEGSLVIPNNAQDRARMYFVTYGTPGSGTLHLRITSKLNPANSDSIVFKINARNLVSVNIPELSSFFIYPNPTSDFLTIKAEIGSKYTLVNLQGQVLKNGIFDNSSNQLDVQNLPRGTYFLQVAFEEKVGVRKVVLQ